MFKVIDGNLTTIFNKVQNITNGVNLSTNSVNRYVEVFNKLNSKQNFGHGWEQFINGMSSQNINMATYFEELAKQGASAKANIQGVYAAILDGNTHGIQNVRSVISMFNSLDPQNQQAFANAVGQTNSKLSGYLSNLNGATASMGGYAKNLAITTLKTVGLRAATMALNMALTAGISWAISKVIQLTSSLVNAFDDSIEKIKEFKDNIDSLEGDIKSLNDELRENIKKLHELEDINTPTLFEQDEIDRLKEENRELENQIRLKEYGLELDKQRINQEAQKAIKNTQSQSAWDWSNNEWYENLINVLTVNGWNNIKTSFTNAGNLFGENFQWQNDWKLENYKLATEQYVAEQEKLNKLMEEWASVDVNNLTSEEYNAYFDEYDSLTDSLDKLQKKIKGYEDDLFEYRNSLQTALLGLDPNDPNNKEHIENIQSFLDIFDSLYEGFHGSKTFTDVYNDTQFANVTVQLEELASAGNLTEETFNNVDGIESFKTALAEIGETDIDKVIQSIISKVDEQSKGLKSDGIPTVQKLTDAYKDLGEQIEKILDLQDKLTSAFEKVASGEVFTAKEAYELLEQFPELYKSVTAVEGGFTFPLDALEDAYKNQNAELIAKIEENSKENQEVFDYYNEQKVKLDGLQNNATNAGGVQGFNALESDEKIKGLSESVSELETMAETAQNEIDKNAAIITVLSGSLDTHAEKMAGIKTQYDTAKDKVDGYNKSISTINQAITSMNEGTALTYDEMMALIDISPSLANAFTKGADGYYITVDALSDVKEQSYETRNSFIDDAIAMIKAEQDIAEATRRSVTARINSYNDWIEHATEIAKIDAELANNQDLINALESMKKEYTSGDSSSSSSKDTVSDELQNQIDYYDKIIQGIESVADERIEAIDKEIEAIEKQKDALKEQNDERQRELDLIEAQNNLEKAKKQKVFVYKEGEGLVQVQDEKVVKDAQKELDDVQREIQEAEYDKQIELLEQQSKAIEDYKKPFTDLKSDIENGLAVEQAKKALGTDEKGLLNLSQETTDKLRDGMASAIVKKDKQDNKDNPYYKDVTLADLLKKLGSTVSPEEFKTAFQPALNYTQPALAYDVQGKTNYQYVTNNNGTTNFTATFNISGTSDPSEVADVVKMEICNLLQKTYNKIK